jgi:hypothetical protein
MTQVDHQSFKTVETVKSQFFAFINTGINPGVNYKRFNNPNRFNGFYKRLSN